MNRHPQAGRERAGATGRAHEREELDLPVRFARPKLRMRKTAQTPARACGRRSGRDGNAESGGQAQTGRKDRMRTSRKRTRVVPQMEAADCGPAALAVVLDYHGKQVPLEELRLTCGASRDGATAAQLVAAAHQYGLVARGFHARPEQLRAMTKPAVAYWDSQHFVVVESVRDRFGRERVQVNDPANGRSDMDREEFERGFTGVVLTFEPGEGFARDTRRRRDVTVLLSRTAGARTVQVMALLAGMSLTASVVAIPLLCGRILDASLADRPTGRVLEGLLAAVVLASVSWACWGHQLARSATRISRQRATLFGGLLRRPIEFFGRRRATALARRVTNSRGLLDVLSRGLVTVVVAGLCGVACAGALIDRDIVLGLLGCGLVVVHGAAVHCAGRAQRDISGKLLAAQGDLGSLTMSTLNGMDAVRASGREQDVFRRWTGVQAHHADRRQRLGARSAAFAALPNVTATATTGVVLIAGGARVAVGGTSPGAVASACLLAWMLTRLVSYVHEVVRQWPDAVAELAGVEDVELHRQATVFETTGPEVPPPCSGDLVVRDLHFGYGSGKDPLLREVNFEVPSGSRVVLCGPSGSGKSTLAKLVAGLYEPWSGEIEVGGRRMADLDGGARANSIAFVDRESFVAEGTVRDNITLWDPAVPDDAVRDALRCAVFEDEVDSWQQGIDTRIGPRGRPLGAGQRQRLEIARAVVRRPLLLVVDEALAQLDAEIEQAVLENLSLLGSALLVVSHRESAVRGAERIVALDGSGTVQRVASYEQLAAVEGACTESSYRT